MPMSSNSNGNSSPGKSKVDGEVEVSRPIGWARNSTIKKIVILK